MKLFLYEKSLGYDIIQVNQCVNAWHGVVKTNHIIYEVTQEILGNWYSAPRYTQYLFSFTGDSLCLKHRGIVSPISVLSLFTNH